MRNEVTIKLEQDFSEKIQAELLARVEIEVRYLVQPVTTKRFIRNLYQEINGRPPARRLNLLDWFFANYQYDEKLKSWSQSSVPILH